MWDSRDLSSARMADFLVRLDRVEVLIAANLAGQKGKYTPAFAVDGSSDAAGEKAVDESTSVRTEPVVSQSAVQAYLHPDT